MKKLLATLFLFTTLSIASMVTQQNGTINLQALGPVSVHTSLPKGGFPTITIIDANHKVLSNTKLGTDNPVLFKIPNGDDGQSYSLRFTPVVDLSHNYVGILGITRFVGGSDCAYEASILGVHNSKLQPWFDKLPGTSAEGGMFLGDLGGGRGYGFAVWDFIWDSNESHVDPHRYHIHLYRYDRTLGKMILTTDIKTKHKYDDGRRALAEFGFHFSDLRDKFLDFDC